MSKLETPMVFRRWDESGPGGVLAEESPLVAKSGGDPAAPRRQGGTSFGMYTIGMARLHRELARKRGAAPVTTRILATTTDSTMAGMCVDLGIEFEESDRTPAPKTAATSCRAMAAYRAMVALRVTTFSIRWAQRGDE